MAIERTPEAEFLEKKSKDAHRAVSDTKEREHEGRMQLKQFAAQLREPVETSTEPARTTQPTFKIGEAKGFPYVPDGPTKGASGHLSPKAEKEFYAHLTDAAHKPDGASRDMATRRAARVVAQDFLDKNFPHRARDTVVQEALHAARAQVTFASREIGQKLGVDPVTSSAIGYSLGRALEQEGFRTFVNHAIDGVGNYVSSSASTGRATGIRAAMEGSLNNSMNWLAEHGVTKDSLKSALTKHAGKIGIMVEMAQHPEAVQKIAQVIARSDSAFDAVYKAATDAEVRKAVGNTMVSAGEVGLVAHKGLGSTAIVAGSLLRNDSAEDVGRHAFRAALSIAGGAAGGVAGGMASGGFLAVAGGMAGSTAGAALADKVLEVYDKHFSREREQPEKGRDREQENKTEFARSPERQEPTKGFDPQAVKERLQERQYSMGRQPG